MRTKARTTCRLLRSIPQLIHTCDNGDIPFSSFVALLCTFLRHQERIINPKIINNLSCKTCNTFSFPLLPYCSHFSPSSLYNNANVFTNFSLSPLYPCVASFVSSVFLDKSTCKYWFSSVFGGHQGSVAVKFFCTFDAVIRPSSNSPLCIPSGSKQPIN